MAEVQGMPAKMILDPRVDPLKPRFLIEKGAEVIQNVRQAANSASNSNIVWNIQVPTVNTVVDKKVYVDLEYRWDLTGTGFNATLLTETNPNNPAETILSPQGFVALRFLPWQSVCQDLNLTINNANVSQNVAGYIQSLVKFGVGMKDYQDGDWSIFPSMEDQFQNYSQGQNTNRNPLASYGNNQTQQTRGSFNLVVDTGTKTDTFCRLTAKWSEPLVLSPLLFSKLEEFGFIGLQTLQFRANTANLERMLSVDGSSVGHPVITSVVGSIVGQPLIRLRFLRPPALDNLYLDPVHHYPYYNIIAYNTQIGNSLAHGASVTLESQNYQLTSIPKRMCIVVRKSDFEREVQSADPNLASYGLSDGYCRIDKVDITWDIKTGVLANANSRELFAMSKRNGSNQNWYQWDNAQGSVLMLDFAHDIGLNMDQAVGLSGQYQFKINVTVTNVTGRTIATPLLQCITMYEGMLRIENNESYLSQGDVFPRDVIEAMLQRDFTHLPYYSYYDFQGGSFWGAVKKFGQRAIEGVKKGYQLYKEHEPEIKSAIGVASKFAPLLLGLGEEERKYKGAGVSAGAMTAGGISAGAMAKRRTLRKKL